MPLKLMQLNCLYAHDEEQPKPWVSRCAVLRRWIAQLNPDIITCQEITRGTRADTGATVDMLADLCAGSALVHHVFGPACDEVMPFVSDGQQEGVSLGNAIASRWPISEHSLSPQLTWQRATVGRGFAAKRSAIWARIETPYGPINCCCTHLDSTGPHDENRLLQMADVLAFVTQRQQQQQDPFVLCGDMNCHQDSDAIQYACGRHAIDGVTSPITLTDALGTVKPDHKSIDYVFVDGLTTVVESCEVVQEDGEFGEWPSDHPAILTWLHAIPSCKL